MSAKFAKIAAIFLATTALCQCSKPAVDDSSNVVVTLTPAAQAALTSSGEKLVVDGFYYGAPVAASAPKVNDDGQIELGQDIVTVEGKSQTVRLPGTGMDPARVDATVIKDGKAMVQVRVYSDTNAPNLLACSTFDDAIAEAHKTPVQIACDVKK